MGVLTATGGHLCTLSISSSIRTRPIVSVAQRTELDTLPGLLDLRCAVQQTHPSSSVRLLQLDIQVDILWVQPSRLFCLVWLMLFRVRTKKELFLFFGIQNATGSKSMLATEGIRRLTTSTTEIMAVVTQPPTAVGTRWTGYRR